MKKTTKSTPDNYIKRRVYLNRKSVWQYMLFADKDSFRMAVFCFVIAIIVIVSQLIGAHMRILAATSTPESSLVESAIEPTAVPTIEPTAIPTVPVYETRTFKITAFCACFTCCKKTDGITFSGAHAREGVTCAADLSVLPLGSVVDIEGIGSRIVQDKSQFVKGDHIDIYMADHQAALKFGVQYRTVKIIQKAEGK